MEKIETNANDKPREQWFAAVLETFIRKLLGFKDAPTGKVIERSPQIHLSATLFDSGFGSEHPQT